MNKFEQWLKDVEDGKRRDLSPEEREEQAAYRIRRLKDGRYPKSYESRLSHAYQIKHRKIEEKIDRLHMIKQIAEGF